MKPFDFILNIWKCFNLTLTLFWIYYFAQFPFIYRNFNLNILTLFFNISTSFSPDHFISSFSQNLESNLNSVVCGLFCLGVFLPPTVHALSGTSRSFHPSMWSFGSSVTSWRRFQSHQTLPPGSPKCSWKKKKQSIRGHGCLISPAERVTSYSWVHTHTHAPTQWKMQGFFFVDQRQADCFRLWGAKNWNGITTNKCDNVILWRCNGSADCSVHSNRSLQDTQWEICER